MQRSLIRPFYPALNGLRAVAILMVFVNHYGALAIGRTIPLMFWPGVDLFFVLSGFLITGILYDSRESERYFRDFYTRRALRIFPLYYGFFVLVRILKPLLHLVYSPLFWSNWLYVSNLVRPWWGIQQRSSGLRSRPPRWSWERCGAFVLKSSSTSSGRSWCCSSALARQSCTFRLRRPWPFSVCGSGCTSITLRRR